MDYVSGVDPSTVKLFFTTPLGDSRVGDEFQGRLIGQPFRKALNACFDELCNQIAVYYNDGNVRVYYILPENFSDKDSRSSSYFGNSLFLPITFQRILSEKNEDIAIQSIQKVFRNNFSVKDSIELNDYLIGKTKTIKSFESLKEQVESPKSIALQPRNRKAYFLNPALVREFFAL
jgi:hypothetical protein